uniref:Uncharacterized protein n=1 Tax=Solanum lycopersicum TaxID=4081 RepID=A0A3Q7F9X4_SOLLC
MIRQETAVNEEHAENFPYVASYYWWYMGCQRLSGHQIIAFLRHISYDFTVTPTSEFFALSEHSAGDGR